MLRTIRNTLAAFAVATLLGCSSTSTRFDWDLQFDFGQLRSWSWHQADPGGAPNDLTQQRVTTAIEATLTARGYPRDDAAPDFRIAWAVSSESKIRASSWGSGYHDPYGAGWSGYYGSRTIDITEYEVGSLIVDVVDSRDNKLVWRGTASRAINRSWTPEEADGIVRDAVEKIFDGFPPKR